MNFPGSARGGAARALAAILLFGLAACGGASPATDGGAVSGDEPETAAADVRAPVARRPAAEPTRDDMAARTPASLDPAELVGLTRDRVREILGQPVFVRRESLAEFWRYRHRTCVLELYFYEKDGVQLLDHIETRTPGRDPGATGRCLGALAASKRSGG